jgi:hypothetical protein
MHYACTLPLLDTPIACRIKITSFCGGPTFESITRNTTTLTYETPNPFNATLKYSQAFIKKLVFPSDFHQETGCYNISFSAESFLGLPVNLLIDDALIYAIGYR